MLLDKLLRGKKIRKFLIGFVTNILILNLFAIQVCADENVVKEIKDILNNYYIEDIQQDTLSKDSVNDIIKNLNDPYTQILDQNDYNNIVNNTFIGTGITIEMTEVGAIVTSVMVNSPAMKSGLKEGDIIITADDNYLSGLPKGDALSILNGKLGDYIELKIVRDNKIIILNVISDEVYYPTVYSKVVDNHIAYIQIVFFGSNTLDEFKYKINSIDTKLIDSYIIDLRNNLGGNIYSAVEIAGYYAKGDATAIAQIKNGARFKLKSTENRKAIDKPTIFLVNKYTASAAELLVACAQDYGTATIVGETTYGKGVAQSVFKLSDGSILKATTLKLFSPKGRDISNIGINPDIYIRGIDSSITGELLVLSGTKEDANTKVIINNKNYYINTKKVKNKHYTEAYRQIISQATLIEELNYPRLIQNGKSVNYPILKLNEVPRTEYKLGEKVIFKLSSPNYKGLVQYRAVLWDESTNQYVDLWNTKDRYYNNWKPRGTDVFTIAYPATRTGNYKIKIFVKRSGIQNSKAALKGMNCDSYVYEIPFLISPSN